MNLQTIRDQALHQAGYTTDDLPDLLPHINHYINEGYDLLIMAFFKTHAEEAGEYPPLRSDKSQPLIPEWAHRSLADYASWMLCRNGSSARQQSGYIFRRAFDEALARARNQGANRINHIPK